MSDRYAYYEHDGFFVDMSKTNEDGEGEELLTEEVLALLNVGEAAKAREETAIDLAIDMGASSVDIDDLDRAGTFPKAAGRYCCFVGCPKKAEFEVWDNNERRPDVGGTDACEDHVGALLGSLPPVGPTGPWMIIVIKESTSCLSDEDAIHLDALAEE